MINVNQNWYVVRQSKEQAVTVLGIKIWKSKILQLNFWRGKKKKVLKILSKIKCSGLSK